tara:strand:- start:669 stop:827 length:159 start_codon:yes stop_codon:yes gene_type:complete
MKIYSLAYPLLYVFEIDIYLEMILSIDWAKRFFLPNWRICGILIDIVFATCS